MEHLIKMPSIPQFRNVITDITHLARFAGLDENEDPIYNNEKLPTVTFKGSVKLHGTNASICHNGNVLWAQSKGNVISPEKDNVGFASYVNTHKDYFGANLTHYLNIYDAEEICVYGEWSGKGIQKGVGISEIDKTFFMFGVKIKPKDHEEYVWLEDPEKILGDISSRGRNVRSIFEFETFEIEVDFDKPKMSQNKMLEITDMVEQECPVAKEYGVSGIGEGVVWVGWFKGTKHNFKIKGEKHANSKVKTLKPVDEAYEQKKIDFANYATPAWRLEQMYAETFDTLNGGKGDVSGTGDFLKAVHADIIKEELVKMQEAGLEPKEVNGMISKVARTWFMEQLNAENGL